MKINILVLTLALAVAGAADARSVGGAAAPSEPVSAPSAPSAPSASAAPADRDPSAQRTNFVFAEDGTKRRTMNPGFCSRHPGDYYVQAKLVRCTGY